MNEHEPTIEILNRGERIETDVLENAFERMFLTQPDPGSSLSAEEVKGGVIDISDRPMEKLELARKMNVDFLRIDGVEYEFNDRESIQRLIDGIKLGMNL